MRPSPDPRRSALRAVFAAALVVPAFAASCTLSSTDPDEGGWSREVSYWEAVHAIVEFPASYDSTRRYPLVVALHGNGGTARSTVPAFVGWAREPLLMAFPQGEYPAGPGYSWFYLTADRTLWEGYDVATVAGVVQMITDLKARYPIDSVFVLGFSQGASLAYMIGLRNPGLVAGVLAIAGMMPDVDTVGAIVHEADIVAAQEVPLFVARGQRDALVSRSVFTAQRDYFVGRGYRVTAFEFDGGHEFTRELGLRALQWVWQRR